MRGAHLRLSPPPQRRCAAPALALTPTPTLPLTSYKGTLNMWVTILREGRDVFHECRRPVDLKDKWRNMEKKG